MLRASRSGQARRCAAQDLLRIKNVDLRSGKGAQLLVEAGHELVDRVRPDNPSQQRGRGGWDHSEQHHIDTRCGACLHHRLDIAETAIGGEPSLAGSHPGNEIINPGLYNDV